VAARQAEHNQSRKRERRPFESGPSLTLPALIVFCVLGCGGGERPLYPIQGTVKVDGRPVKDVMVRFHPLNDPSQYPLPSSALTAEDGSFTLSSFRTADGAYAGEYAVTFLWYDVRVDGQGENVFSGPDKLGGRYRDPASSKFKVSVKPGVNEPFTFDLQRGR
jgi:hypothetical protein